MTSDDVILLTQLAQDTRRMDDEARQRLLSLAGEISLHVTPSSSQADADEVPEYVGDIVASSRRFIDRGVHSHTHSHAFVWLADALDRTRREREEARADVSKVVQQMCWLAHDSQALIDERDALTARVAAMQPVFDAALAFEEARGRYPFAATPVYDAAEVLAKAVIHYQYPELPPAPREGQSR